MRLRYTRHVKQRMTERHIMEFDVEKALLTHFERISTPENSIRYRGYGTNGDVLKVWVVPDQDASADKVIKSAAWDGK